MCEAFSVVLARGCRARNPDLSRSGVAARDWTSCVYITSSLSGALYTGVTNDLERRVFEHEQGKAGSFTARYNVNRLAYVGEFGDISEAIAREKENQEDRDSSRGSHARE